MSFPCSFRAFKAFCCALLIIPGTLLQAQQDSAPTEYASLEAEVLPRALPLAVKTEPAVVPERRFNREWLAEEGLAFSFGYTAEAFTNIRRDDRQRRGTEYLGSFDLTIDFDLRKLGLARGHVTVNAENVHGRGINAPRVGAFQAPSNLDSDRFSKFTEIYYSDSYAGDRIRIKGGRQYADSDFSITENAAEFLNSSYGLVPTIPCPTYPSPMLGASVWVFPARWISAGVGVYRGGSIESAEFPIMKQGLFSIAELNLTPYATTSAVHGVYRIGVWQQGSGSFRRDNGLRQVRNGGLYATADHWFRRANSSGTNVGPGVFVQAGWSPADRNEITAYVGGGFAWKGLLTKRPEDAIGVGITQVKLSTAGRETATEVYYRWQVSKQLAVQPDVQFVNRPYGAGRNAVVAGIRTVFVM